MFGDKTTSLECVTAVALALVVVFVSILWVKSCEGPAPMDVTTPLTTPETKMGP